MSTSIAILGAGLSGVLMGIRLIQIGLGDFVIYERQADVGGTWYRNTYPGLHCDMPSHIYCYSFEPNPDFSMVYAGQPEIQGYIRACAEKYGLMERIRFEASVELARYDDRQGVWTLEMDDGSTTKHRLVISATGGLTEPHYPRIEGRESFTGHQWHSGAWRHDVSLADKSVAVIGSAASAVQVVPAVAERARHVTVFSRTPNWVTPRGNANYTPAEQDALRSQANWHQIGRAHV